MNNPFDYSPDADCDAAFRNLTRRIEQLKLSGEPKDINFCREVEDGKMLGVLIAEDADGNRHTLYAFSGQLGDGGFNFEGFVEPAFDYLRPDGYFKTHEADISRQNHEIDLFEKNVLRQAMQRFEEAKLSLEAEVDERREKYRISKSLRAKRRQAGSLTESELDALIRESQHEKAELHRLKKRAAAELEPYAAALQEAQDRLAAMKEKRRADSEALQEWLFTNFRMLNARGESRSLSEIFAATALKAPPSGAGECCAPKLLQSAYLLGWKPMAMAEYWYGRPKDGELRRHGEHYPACRGKCLPILTWMLQGLDIYPPLDSERYADVSLTPAVVFENKWFCVIDKPAGMLSVKGKGAALSVQEWLERRYGEGRFVRLVHRLDQDTSGLLIAAFSEPAFKTLQSMFALRKIHKTYIAELEGDFNALGKPAEGRIDLPLLPDWLDRPRQKVDMKDGKEALTDYRFLGVSDGRSRIEFRPLTGRTHQLRMHAASAMGLGMPIAGDRLYGSKAGRSTSRMLLHAHKIEFTFPLKYQEYIFESPLPF